MNRAIFLTGFLVLSSAAALRAEDPVVPQEKSTWEKRFEQERRWHRQGSVFIPYRSNYIMPWTYNTTPHPTSTHNSQHQEAKFQLSFKILIMEGLFDREAHLYFGYTQLSLWQLYDRSRSSPFRDTNYEPEAIVTLDSQMPLGHVMLRQTDIGLVHQSNGTSDPDSRSWDRLYARFMCDWDNLAFSIRPWIRIPDPVERDNNKNIEKYMGYGDVEIAHATKNHVLSLLLRNNLRARNNKGAVEVNYQFPLTRILTGAVQYFHGYGETLIDYNRPVDRFSIGLALSYQRLPEGISQGKGRLR